MGNNRKYQIDFLKIFATFMVIILHILLKGALKMEMGTSQYLQSWGLEFFCMPAVNIYAIITGFLCYEKNNSIKRLFFFYTKTLFYSLVCFGIFAFVFPSHVFNIISFTQSLFIISNNSYWYLTAYMITMLLSPFLNAGIEKITQGQFKSIIFSLLFMMVAIPFFTANKAPYLNGGYNALWLIVLYMVGAYIAKYTNIESIKRNRWKFVITILICVICSTLIRFFGDFKEIIYFTEIGNQILDYNTPFGFIQAVSMFLLFLSFDIKNEKVQKVIRWFSNKTFWIYIVHCGPITLTAITGVVATLLNLNKNIIIIDVLFLSGIVFILSLILCVIIEFFYKILCNILRKCFKKTQDIV